MSHKDVDVASRIVQVLPDNRMIAHLNGGIRLIGGFVHTSYNAYFGPRALVVGIPLLLLHHERCRYTLHTRMAPVFDIHLCLCKGRDVVLIDDIFHKPGEPLPHRVTIELTEQRCMVEADPASLTLLDIVLECGGGRWLPAVRRIV